jgi:hypothetical protein
MLNTLKKQGRAGKVLPGSFDKIVDGLATSALTLTAGGSALSG